MQSIEEARELMKKLGWKESKLRDLRFIGYSYLLVGHYKMASIFFKGLVAVDPENAYDVKTLGALYLELGKYEEAIKYLTHAEVLAPTDDKIKINRAKSLVFSGNLEEGLKACKRLQKNRSKRISDQATALILAYN